MAEARVVYGLHAVRALLQGGKGRGAVQALLVSAGERGEAAALAAEARRLGLAAQVQEDRPRGELDRLAQGGVHQGIVAVCGEYAYASLDQVLQAAGDQPLLCLVLDGVTDPQNLGALLRSALTLGAHGVVLPQDRAAPVNATVVKASSGASELLPVARVTNLVRAMEELREAGVWLCAAELSDRALLPWQVDLRAPTALVLGAEGKGLRPLVRKTCDLHLRVPMAGNLQGASLNVAACGAVLLYEALRQRSAKRP